MTARVMDHEEAIRNFTVERYLLGELPENDRDAYEEHLFSCPVCFEQVKAGTEFVGQVQRIGAEDARTAAHPGFISILLSGMRQPVATVAFALLLCAIGMNVYQSRIIRGSRNPQVASEVFLSDGAKAEGIKQVTASKNAYFVLNLQLVQKGSYTRYQGEVQTEAGKFQSKFHISLEEANDTIHLVLNSAGMGEGTYQIVIQGVTEDGKISELTRFPFNFHLQE